MLVQVSVLDHLLKDDLHEVKWWREKRGRGYEVRRRRMEMKELRVSNGIVCDCKTRITPSLLEGARRPPPLPQGKSPEMIKDGFELGIQLKQHHHSSNQASPLRL
ncbi:hypothetical protein NL676_002970 [Syzygium grande]|nr:hypothetical protein NL676_002970 [Syzygium grande]